jgi:hypothetical protein
MGSSIVSSGDIKSTIIAVMKEMTKKSKFINKNEIYTVLKNSFDYGTFERALNRLAEDGTVNPTYDDIYTLEE